MNAEMVGGHLVGQEVAAVRHMKYEHSGPGKKKTRQRLTTLNIGFMVELGPIGLGGCPNGLGGTLGHSPPGLCGLSGDGYCGCGIEMKVWRGCRWDPTDDRLPSLLCWWGCSQVGEGDIEGERERDCIGGGETLPEAESGEDGSTDARL